MKVASWGVAMAELEWAGLVIYLLSLKQFRKDHVTIIHTLPTLSRFLHQCREASTSHLITRNTYMFNMIDTLDL